MADSEKVRKFKTRLADKIGDSRFRTWFGDVSTIELADDAVQITAPSKFVADWIATNFEREITAVAEEFMRQRCQISIRVLEQPIARPAPVSPRRKKPRAARSAAFADTRRPLSGTF
ncbi:MAG: DnaA N-terminal domain-containing protein, partial [Phycisphaerae bacterium]